MDLGGREITDIAIEDVQDLTPNQKMLFMVNALRAVTAWHSIGMALPLEAMKMLIDIELTSTEMGQEDLLYYNTISNIIQVFDDGRKRAESCARENGIEFLQEN